MSSSGYIPYFYVISDSADLTIKPRIFTDNKFVLQTEYRKVTKNSKNILDLSLTEGHDSSKNDANDSRSHIFSNSIIDLDLDSYENIRISFLITGFWILLFALPLFITFKDPVMVEL